MADVFDQAVDQLETHLRDRDFSLIELKDIPDKLSKKGIKKAWLTSTISKLRGKEKLVVGVTQEYPYCPPCFFLDEDLCLTVPHIESDGGVCLMPESGAILPSDPVGVFQQLNKDLKLLLSQSSEENSKDFINEFASYFAIHLDKLGSHKSNNVYGRSILNLEDTSDRYVYLTADYLPKSTFISKEARQKTKKRRKKRKGKNCTLVLSETSNGGKSWLSNRFSLTKEPLIKKIPLIWLDSPLLPQDYPTNNRDILTLTQRKSVEAEAMLIEQTPPLNDRVGLYLALGVKTENGNLIYLLHLQEPPRKGVRSNKIDFFGKRTLTYIGISRVDTEWSSYRAGVGNGKLLSDIKVAIVGCGSLGGYVADQLARAGVCNFALFDSDIYTWDNINRHLLPNIYVGLNKAKAMRTHLTMSFPNTSCRAHSIKIEKALSDNGLLSELKSADIIVSLAGDRNGERFLNYIQRSEKLPPIVYGWTEAYGVAGHAIYISGDNACLQCLCDEFFSFKYQAVEWDNSPIQKIPACGQSFAPYGCTESFPICSMITSLVLEAIMGQVHKDTHRVYFARHEIINNAGGFMKKSSLKYYGELKDGQNFLSLDIEANPKCEVCK